MISERGAKMLAHFRSGPGKSVDIESFSSTDTTSTSMVAARSPKPSMSSTHLQQLNRKSSDNSNDNLYNCSIKPVDLSKCHPSLTNPNVPAFVDFCVSMIEMNGMKFVGIYRVPGNNAAVAALQKRFGSIRDTYDVVIKGADTNSRCDIAAYTSALKQFFRSLPDPLFPFHLYDPFIAANKLRNPKDRLLTLKKIVLQMPEWHFETLHFIVNHLNKVAGYAEHHKMDRQNMAIVFGPTLFRRPSGSESSNFLKRAARKPFAFCNNNEASKFAADSLDQCCIVQTILANSQWFFDRDPSSLLTVPEDSTQNGMHTCSLHHVFNRLNNSLTIEQAKSCDGESPSFGAESRSSAMLRVPNMKYMVKSAPNIPSEVAEAAEEQSKADADNNNNNNCGSNSQKNKSSFTRKLKLVRNIFRKTSSTSTGGDAKRKPSQPSSLSIRSSDGSKGNSFERNSPPHSAHELGTSPTSSAFFSASPSQVSPTNESPVDSSNNNSSTSTNTNPNSAGPRKSSFLEVPNAQHTLPVG